EEFAQISYSNISCLFNILFCPIKPHYNQLQFTSVTFSVPNKRGRNSSGQRNRREKSNHLGRDRLHMFLLDWKNESHGKVSSCWEFCQTINMFPKQRSTLLLASNSD
ncbi:hypothetical protein HN51_012106, partial [Arachis hypogaea]